MGVVRGVTYCMTSTQINCHTHAHVYTHTHTHTCDVGNSSEILFMKEPNFSYG